MNTFVLTYLLSLFAVVAVTPMVMAAGKKLNAYDRPNVRKVHTHKIPCTGGIAIFLSAIAAITCALLLDNVLVEEFGNKPLHYSALLASATFILLVGAVDDLCNIRVRHKLLAQIAAAVSIYIAGVRIESVDVTNLLTVQFGMMSLPLTVLWIVGMTNTVNFTDGLDGLAAGICTVACAVVAFFAIVHHEAIVAVIMLAVMGSLSGFLFFNFNPARIFMGDSGSMCLGFILSACSVMCLMQTGTIVALALPAIALGLGIFDTAHSIVRRYIHRRSIASPDREHLHHRLVDMGLRHRQAVIIMYAITIATTAMGMFMMITDGVETIVILVCVVVLLGIAHHIASSVKIHELLKGVRRRLAVSKQVKEERQRFDNIQLHFKKAATFDEWWQAVCLAGDRLDAERMSLEFVKPGGKRQQELSWRNNADSTTGFDRQDTVHTTVPVSDSRCDGPLKLSIEIKTNGSIESAGRRIALLARLMEEY